jgi:hypothetical protein
MMTDLVGAVSAWVGLLTCLIGLYRAIKSRK